MESEIVDPENTYPIDTLYAWISVDDKGNEGIMNINIKGQNFPAVSGKLETVQSMESWVKHAKAKTKKKIHLKKYSNGTVMRRL
jgi:hypothetical protein